MRYWGIVWWCLRYYRWVEFEELWEKTYRTSSDKAFHLFHPLHLLHLLHPLHPLHPFHRQLKSPEQLYSYLSLSTTSNSPEIARASLSRLHSLNHHASLPQIQTFLTRWESSEGWGRVLTDCLKKPKEENLYNDILKIISSSSIKVRTTPPLNYSSYLC